MYFGIMDDHWRSKRGSSKLQELTNHRPSCRSEPIISRNAVRSVGRSFSVEELRLELRLQLRSEAQSRNYASRSRNYASQFRNYTCQSKSRNYTGNYTPGITSGITLLSPRITLLSLGTTLPYYPLPITLLSPSATVRPEKFRYAYQKF